jgi:serum/glucocorticoid-regulated kinase 2
MGNCDCNLKDLDPNKLSISPRLNLDDFCLLYPIGRGGFGRVWKVRLKRQYNSKISDIRLQKNKSRIFAMKEMSKAKISLKKSIKSVANERKFLEKFHFNLLCNMYYAFQDDDTLYIIMDYLSGGDLRYMICRRNFFTEEETKFIAACITLNLNYIHDKNVIHRDIKPENLVFGANGYLHLTDFGIALEYHRGENGVRSASGTPGYMAPEAITNKRQEFSVDYFALGVIVYELMLGERPYQGKNRKEIKEQMMNLEIKLDKDDLPEDWKDENIIDLINKLLERKKKKRLGFKTDLEVKNHPYFNNISFDLIENMKFESPFIFDTEDNFDDSYAQMQENDSIYEGNKEIFIDEVNESNMFKDFYYNIEDILIQNNQIAEGKENKTKTDLTSKTSNKKNGEDTSIVIHNIKSKKNKRRKSAKFIGIQPDEDKKVVNVIRKGNKSGSLRLNLNKVDDD